MFGIDEADKTVATTNVQTPETTTTSSEPDSSCATMIEINAITADNAKDSNPMDTIAFDDKTHEVIRTNSSIVRKCKHQIPYRIESNLNRNRLFSTDTDG